MARIKNGILGGFTGKVGTVVGCNLNGEYYMRSLPKARVSTEISKAELANRKKFAVAQSWLKPLTEFLRLGFKNYSPTCRGFVAAKSYLLKNAVCGDYPDLYVDPSLALVSFGDLQGCNVASAVYAGEGKICFSWSTEKTAKTASENDLVMLLAYDCQNEKTTIDTAAARRKDGNTILEIKKDDLGGTADLYLSFISTDHERISNSQYLGKVNLK